jgi:hypothetical protein
MTYTFTVKVKKEIDIPDYLIESITYIWNRRDSEITKYYEITEVLLDNDIDIDILYDEPQFIEHSLIL